MNANISGKADSPAKLSHAYSLQDSRTERESRYATDLHLLAVLLCFRPALGPETKQDCPAGMCRNSRILWCICATALRSSHQCRRLWLLCYLLIGNSSNRNVASDVQCHIRLLLFGAVRNQFVAWGFGRNSTENSFPRDQRGHHCSSVV